MQNRERREIITAARITAKVGTMDSAGTAIGPGAPPALGKTLLTEVARWLADCGGAARLEINRIVLRNDYSEVWARELLRRRALGYHFDRPVRIRVEPCVLCSVLAARLRDFYEFGFAVRYRGRAAIGFPVGRDPDATFRELNDRLIPEKFFDQLPEVLQTVPPLPGEEALYGLFKAMLDAAATDPRIKETLTQTAVAAEAELIQPLFEFRNNGRPVGNGWTSPPNGAHWGADYLSRTATAKSNMYDNAPQETRYIYTDVDAGGQRLSGGNNYAVTFAAGQVPPVNGFWSLTVYNKEHLFEPNRLNRFSLGTKSKSMKENSDGSLTLYFQNASPGAEREANWVPTPKDEFSLYIRAYWPKAKILDGSWTPPPVTRNEVATGSSTPPASGSK